ncbi:MAG: DNA methyltransferase [Bdellovibrionota bacterium]
MPSVLPALSRFNELERICGEDSFKDQLRSFRQFGKKTACLEIAVLPPDGQKIEVSTFINEFWTSLQRQAHSLHEISYRACFKPQLPRFFIERLTAPGEAVYDPFMGRGTTLVEAALLGRIPMGCDVNPLSRLLVAPRLGPPSLEEITARLEVIDWDRPGEEPRELLAFYHRKTLRRISSLRRYLLERESKRRLDGIDEWIRMVATNRLTGHSEGFFSVYTLPPNQAVSVESQRRINRDRRQKPPVRDVAAIILKKSRFLLKHLGPEERTALASSSAKGLLLTGPSARTPRIPDESVSLVVTSPPFLDVVDYKADNWLRCWFCGIDPEGVEITMSRRLEDWKKAMTGVLKELHRVLRPGGYVAFEVGEVRGGRIRLEEAVVPCGMEAGLSPVLILINDQKFTKTANCWGVSNNAKGTNTNRIVVFRKE